MFAPPWRTVRLDRWPGTRDEWFALWLSVLPDGRVRAPRGRLADDAAPWFEVSRRPRWIPRSELWMHPRTGAEVIGAVPDEPFAPGEGFRRWNSECARSVLRSVRSAPVRTIGVCIPTDDATAARPQRVLSLLNLLSPGAVALRAVVPTGTARIEAALAEWDRGSGGAVASVDIVHDTEAFRFARRVNLGAGYLLDRYADVDAILLANDDTAPTAAACARLATWPTHNALVGAVSNAGGGGLQTVEDPGASPSETSLIDSPHRLGGFFLYATRDLWTALDGFDEDYAGYGCDDTAFSLSAHALGARILIDPLAYVWHEGAATFGRSAIPDLHPEALAIFRRKHPHIRTYSQPLSLDHTP